MFGTLRYNEVTQQNDHIMLSSADGGEARGYTSNACNACRARKIKCTGDPGGCSRCKEGSRKCVYRAKQSPSQEVATSDPASSGILNHSRAPASETDSFISDANNMESLYYWTGDWEPSDGAVPLLANSLSSNSSPRTEPSIDAAPLLHTSPSATFATGDMNIFHARADLKLDELLTDIDCSLETGQYSRCETGKRKRQRHCNTNNSLRHPQPNGLSMLSSPSSSPSANESLLFGLKAPEDSVFNERPKTASTISTSEGCDCSVVLTRLLSQASVHLYHRNGSGSSNSGATIDQLLICLDSGLKICEETLRCLQCNAKIGDGFLITTAVHQLGAIARQLADELCPGNTCEQHHCLPDQDEKQDLDKSPEDFDFLVAKLQQNNRLADSIMLLEDVSIGNYTVQNRHSKVRFVYSIVLGLFFRMRKILDHVKHKVRQNRTAWNVVVDSEYLVVQALSLMRDSILQ